MFGVCFNALVGEICTGGVNLFKGLRKDPFNFERKGWERLQYLIFDYCNNWNLDNAVVVAS